MVEGHDHPATKTFNNTPNSSQNIVLNRSWYTWHLIDNVYIYLSMSLTKNNNYIIIVNKEKIIKTL